MISDQLRDYIKVCQEKGIPNDSIRQELLKVGWPASTVNEALPPSSYTQPPVIPIQPAYPTYKPHKKTGLVISLTLALILFAGTGTIAFAEYGYLPSVSRLYRKTNLPLLWKGSNADATISIGNALARSAAEKNLKYEGSYSIIIKSTNGGQSAYIRDLPLIGKKLSQLLPQKILANQPLIATTEAIAASATPLDTAVPAALNLPLEINASYKAQTDKDTNSEAEFSLDLKSITKAIPEFGSLISPDITKAEAKVKVFPSKKTAYVNSNVLPAKQNADTGKWFGYDLPSDSLKGMAESNPYTSDLLPKGEDLNKLRELIKVITKDNGIVRHNKEALAHYTLTIDKTTISAIKNNPTLKSYLEYLIGIDTDSLALTAQIYIEPHSGRLKEISVAASLVSSSSPYALSMAISNKMDYDTIPNVALPEKDKIHAQKLYDYLEEISALPSSQLASTGILTKESWDMVMMQTTVARINAQNALRKSNIAQLGMHMEIYLSDQEATGASANPPSTNGSSQRLDQASSALSSIAGFASLLPLEDPDGDPYYFAYKSDGSNYEFTCVLLDATGKPASLYGIRNGSTFEQAL